MSDLIVNLWKSGVLYTQNRWQWADDNADNSRCRQHNRMSSETYDVKRQGGES